MYRCKFTFITLAVFVVLAAPAALRAEPPQIQTEGAVIYLADNLNEEAKLGWCIDTRGRGFSEWLHAHSCKPSGGDTQFLFDSDRGAIESVAFRGKCMTLNDPTSANIPFGLLDCRDDDLAQQFVYDQKSMEIRLQSDVSRCVTVAETITKAGPFQSRALVLAACADLAAGFRQWVVRP